MTVITLQISVSDTSKINVWRPRSQNARPRWRSQPMISAANSKDLTSALLSEKESKNM